MTSNNKKNNYSKKPTPRRKQFFYYQIIPLVRLSLAKSNEFTYHSNNEILFGSIVKIKLNNKIVRGVVVGDNSNGEVKTTKNKNKKTILTKLNFKTSPVLEVIIPAQITQQQFKLAKLISRYYLTPLSTTLKFFAFKLTKNDNPHYFKNLTEQVSKINESKWQEEMTLTAPQKNAIKKIIFRPRRTSLGLANLNSQFSTLLFGPPASGKTEVIIEVIKKTLEDKQQSLVLIPEIFLSYQEIVRYSSKFTKMLHPLCKPVRRGGEGQNSRNSLPADGGRIFGGFSEVAILHSQLKPSEITTIWNGVKSGQIKIVISTRMGIFLPFKKLGLIVVDEEQDISHKQWDTPPFYHTRDIANLMQKIYTTPCVKGVKIRGTRILGGFYI